MKRLALSLLLATGGASLAQPLGDRLIAAARDGIDKDVAALLAAHAPVDKVDDTGATALAWAVQSDNESVVARLLKAHANPNLADANGVTPLALAIDGNHPQTAKLLLAAGADPALALPTGETPLMSAARVGSPEIVALLLARKVDVNARDRKFQQTALMWATGKPAIVRLLIDHGADVMVASRSWSTETTNYTVVLSLMSTGSDWAVDNEYRGSAGGITPLIFAAQKGDLESVKMLLDAGADVNQASADGTTPLLASLYHFVPEGRNVRRTQRGMFDGLSFAADYRVANLLLDRGARVDVADRAGYTPLHGAVLSLVTFNSGGLIVTGYDTTIGDAGRARDPNAPGPVRPHDVDGGMALVARLLALGADPNAATRDTSPGPLGAVKINPATIGSTPYHLAAVSNNAQLVAMLAHKGADPNIVRFDGHTPFSVAVLSDFPAVVQTMADHGANMTMIYAPAEKIEAPGLDRAQPRKGQTITHIAAEALAYRVLPILAANGAPLEAKNALGETPLDIADNMERTRYAATVRALGNSDLKTDKVVRETSTSDALKTLIAKRSRLATN